MDGPRFTRPAIAEHIARQALDGPPLLLSGPPGAGKTTLLRELADVLRRSGAAAWSLDLFTAAASPLHLARSAADAARAAGLGDAALAPIDRALRRGREGEADAVRALLEAFAGLREADGRPLVLLLDEPTEVRSLSFFEGLRGVADAFAEAIARRGTRAVLSTSFPTAAGRTFGSAVPLDLPTLSAEDVRSEAAVRGVQAEAAIALSAGRPAALRALLDAVEPGDSLETAWIEAMAPGEVLERLLRASYETLLLRSRSYAMAKAVLWEVARDEGCNLTALFRRLERSPGAVKDYLTAVLDVDVLRMEGKRYHFVDPLLRTWVLLYGGGGTPSAADRALQAARLLELPAVPAAATAPKRTRAARPAAVPLQVPATAEPEQAPARQRPRDTLMEID
ncbi:MAG: ATP-binding protein [Vicinamibacteria bacterium]|nr:ATP-binding protein [Vicinamibacteria bacterium]